MTEASSIHGKYKPAEQVDKLIITSACEIHELSLFFRRQGKEEVKESLPPDSLYSSIIKHRIKFQKNNIHR
jgi:hypothetical protein